MRQPSMFLRQGSGGVCVGTVCVQGCVPCVCVEMCEVPGVLPICRMPRFIHVMFVQVCAEKAF